ncbi:hypothetical protein [Qipengyuania marisflavi]|uniref:Adenylate cyclase n=1 Tax=Qipengyuania marisflavi TaxID=2486356 RepID=A0A5S3P786_9SPHN|nr:hypothetical protein [Qipengyuania marisflavi]TMM49017.1 hypothetical protein FEV51_06480 [Qipengyuania marisflavi]
MNLAESIEAEISAILASPIFERARMQSKLLRYLALKAVEGTGAHLTQYEIATEGLGRNADFDDATDSYVRVHVSRLRTSLRGYYARHQPLRNACIYLRPGSYRLRAGSFEVAYPNLARRVSDRARSAAVEAPPQSAIIGDIPAEVRVNKQKNIRQYVLLSVLVAALGIWGILTLSDILKPSVVEAEGPLMRPGLSISINPVGFSSQDEDFKIIASRLRADARDHLAKSLVARHIRDDDEVTRPFALEVTIARESQNQTVANFTLYDPDGNPIYHGERESSDNGPGLVENLEMELNQILSPPGILSRHLADQISGAPRSDLECFVMLEVGSSNDQAISDPLQGCIDNHANSSYYPYFVARQLFGQMQAEVADGSVVSMDSSQWEKLGALVTEFPDNQYLNFLVAKALLSNGRCDDAKVYIKRASIQGTKFPALEQSLNIERLGCPFEDMEESEIIEQIIRIATSYDLAPPLLEVYSLIGLMAINRPDLISDTNTSVFSAVSGGGTGKLIVALKSVSRTRSQFGQKDAFNRLVWNPKVRNQTFTNIKLVKKMHSSDKVL